jgi:predicted NAD-dependent protein-ADP-ribosyltransferase YbiA (DUF1768 family)
MGTQNPERLEALGARIQDHKDKEWRSQAYQRLVEVNWEKFSKHPQWANVLLATMDTRLLYTNPNDSVWGIGLHASDPRISVETKYPGLNLLGLALQEVRTRLRAELKDRTEVHCVLPSSGKKIYVPLGLVTELKGELFSRPPALTKWWPK